MGGDKGFSTMLQPPGTHMCPGPWKRQYSAQTPLAGAQRPACPLAHEVPPISRPHLTTSPPSVNSLAVSPESLTHCPPAPSLPSSGRHGNSPQGCLCPNPSDLGIRGLMQQKGLAERQKLRTLSGGDPALASSQGLCRWEVEATKM